MNFRKLAGLVEQEVVIAEEDGCVYLWTAEQERQRLVDDSAGSCRANAHQLWQAKRQRSEMAFNDEFNLLSHLVNAHHERNTVGHEHVRTTPAVSSRVFPLVLEAPSRTHIVAAAENGLFLPHWIVRVSATKYQVGWWVMRTNKEMKALVDKNAKTRERAENKLRNDLHTLVDALENDTGQPKWKNVAGAIRTPFHEGAQLEFFSFVQGYVYGLSSIVPVDKAGYRSAIAAASGRAGGEQRSARKSEANRANSELAVAARRQKRERRRDAIRALIREDGKVPSASYLKQFLPPDVRAGIDTLRKDLRDMGLRQ